jgi:molecular chaperone GrpE
MSEERTIDDQGSQELPGSETHDSQALPAPSETDLLFERVAELEAMVEQLKDQLLRKAAEFENYKKRTENEGIDRVKYASEGLIQRLLPVVDDFDRFMKSSTGSADAESLRKGIDLIQQKFMKILGGEGLSFYAATGTVFDPALHDALLQVAVPGVAPHTVVEEVEKGYRLHDKVLRHSKVIVAADQDGQSSGTPQEQS